MLVLRAHTIASKTEMWWFASGASGSTTRSLGAYVRGAAVQGDQMVLLVQMALLVLAIQMGQQDPAVEEVAALRMEIVGTTQPPHVRSA